MNKKETILTQYRAIKLIWMAKIWFLVEFDEKSLTFDCRQFDTLRSLLKL